MKKPVIRKLTAGNYDAEAPKRIFPIDNYTFDERFLAGCEYHILLVPISGQNYDLKGIDTPWDWCGRTASTMIYNYFALLEGGDPRDRYVTLWKGGNDKWALDFRWPASFSGRAKGRAFHQRPDDEPTKWLSGALTIRHTLNGTLTWWLPKTTKHEIELPTLVGRGYSDSYRLVGSAPGPGAERLALGRRIASSPSLIEQAFEPALKSFKNNNPCMLFTRFSKTGSDGHIVCLNGYVRRPDGSLWIAVADPETFSSRVDAGMFKKVKDLANPQPDENLVWVLGGNWAAARGSLVLIRASHFFAAHFLQTSDDYRGQLYTDYGKAASWGQLFAAPDVYTEVPGGVALSSTRLPEDPTARFDLHYPFRLPEGDPSSPVHNFLNNESGQGGFFPLGLRRNVHSGAHLRPFQALPPEQVSGQESGPAGAPLEEGEVASDPAAVHAMAPGYVVAARLAAATVAGQDVVGGHLGFVLLRHVLKQLSEPDAQGQGGGQEEERHVLYSLYMHLAPVSAEALESGRGPGWLQRLLANSRGLVVGAGSQALSPGESRWAAAPLEGPELSGTVALRGLDGEGLELDLGAPSEGRPVPAILKPPPADLGQAREGLLQGHVMTLDRPLVPIEGGEVLGTVSPYFGVDPAELETGFLHWELFAPEGAGLSKVLELAQELVGAEGFPGGELTLGESEEEQANLFEAEALDDLLSPLLPEAEREELDHEQGLLARWHYEPVLRQLFNHPSVLSFADGATDDVSWEDWAAPEPLSVEDAAARAAAEQMPQQGSGAGAQAGELPPDFPYDGDLTYPLTLEVENFAPKTWKPSSAEPFHLEVRFLPDWLKQRGSLALDSEAEEWTFTLQVPAAATKIVLEPRDGAFRIDTMIDLPEPLEVQKKALAALLPRRWRGVKLTRSPEYALEAVKATLAPRFNDIEALTPFLEPIAWWNSGREGQDGRPREVAVLGPEGEEVSLFSPDGLPAEGKLDFVNPIAGLWLLNTLVVAGRASFVKPDELARVDADGGGGKPLDWGLVPGPGVDLEDATVGQVVQALVVTDDYASGRALTLQGIPQGGGEAVELGTFVTQAGVLSVPIHLPGWGTWKLGVKDHQGQSRAKLPLEVTIPAPTLGPVGSPARAGAGYAWRLPFTAHAPEQLECYVGYRSAVVEVGGEPPSTWTEEPLRTPALATLLPEAPRKDSKGVLWSAAGDLVMGYTRSYGDPFLPDPLGKKAGNKFNAHEFFPKKNPPQQVSIRAIKLLNEVRLAHDEGMSVIAVEDAGWAVLAGDSSDPKSAEVFEDLMKVAQERLSELRAGEGASAWEGCKIERDDERKCVRVVATPPPRTAGGTLGLSFDPALALAALVESKGDSLQPKQCLAVSFGVVAPKQGWRDQALLEEELLGQLLEEVSASDAGDSDAIQVWTPDPAAYVVNVSFGGLSYSVQGTWLTLSVPLEGGTLADWRAAKPVLDCGGKKLSTSKVVTAGAGASVGTLTAKVNLSKATGQTEFVARTAVASPKFFGVEASVSTVDLSLDLTPRLEEAEVRPADDEPGQVVVCCQAPFVPSGKGLQLRVSKGGVEVKELAKAAVFHVANKGSGGTALKGSGCRDDDMNVIAQLSLEELSPHFEPGESLELEFYRPSGWGAPKLTPVSCSALMPSEPREQKAVEAQDIGG